MNEAIMLPFESPCVRPKEVTDDFDGDLIPSDDGGVPCVRRIAASA